MNKYMQPGYTETIGNHTLKINPLAKVGMLVVSITDEKGRSTEKNLPTKVLNQKSFSMTDWIASQVMA